MACMNAEDFPDHQAHRREFLTLAAGAMAVAGSAAGLWPFLQSLAPAADTLAAAGALDVDVSSLLSGQQIVVQWRGMPIFIVRRTAEMLASLQQVEMQRLRDPDSLEIQQPAYASNWHRSLSPDILVVVGICTHLGCVPSFQPSQVSGGAMPGGGYFCACHGSRYDLAGRVHKNVPAPYNLPVPPYRLIDDRIVRIGENPDGEEWDLGAIRQL